MVSLKIRGSEVVPGSRPLVMGILNVTADSFYDGGRYQGVDAALARAEQMYEEGVDIIDVGGESTRPGAEPVDEAEEMRRVLPTVEALVKRFDVPVSVDTYKGRVAEEALFAGASIVNDVSALRFDERMGDVVARHGAVVVLMHMKGTPRTMQHNPVYDDVVAEVEKFLRERVDAASAFGIPSDHIMLDPGIGFGKRLHHNLALLRGIPRLKRLGFPLLVGPSRKSFIGEILDLPASERLEGTLAAVSVSVFLGADVVRVHDVREACRACRVAAALREDAPC